jgi:hypothetical protein
MWEVEVDAAAAWEGGRDGGREEGRERDELRREDVNGWMGRCMNGRINCGYLFFLVAGTRSRNRYCNQAIIPYLIHVLLVNYYLLCCFKV